MGRALVVDFEGVGTSLQAIAEWAAIESIVGMEMGLGPLAQHSLRLARKD